MKLKGARIEFLQYPGKDWAPGKKKEWIPGTFLRWTSVKTPQWKLIRAVVMDKEGYVTTVDANEVRFIPLSPEKTGRVEQYR